MAMRAKGGHDYVHDSQKLGVRGGKHKEDMNSMFDTRGQETENAQKNLLEVLQNNKAKYDKGLFADWIVKAYSKCSQDCLITPQMSDLS